MDFYSIKEFLKRFLGVVIVIVIVIVVICLYNAFKSSKNEVIVTYSDVYIMLPSGNRVIAKVGIGDGDIWIPEDTLKKLINKKVQWSKRDETLYIGEVPNAEIMSKVIGSPYNYVASDIFSEIKTNAIMKMSGETFTLGYSFVSVNKADFNMDNKYSKIVGKIGLEDNSSKRGAVVEAFVDDKLVKTYELVPGELYQDINLDVSGALKLSFCFKGINSFTQVNLANMYIK